MSAPLHDQIIEQAYNTYADALFRFCLLKVKNREKAVDIAQDAFIKTFAYIKSGKQVTNIKSFLYKTAQNLVYDEFRRKHSQSLDEMSDEGFDIAADDEAGLPLLSIDSERALKALESLDETYREVVTLRFLEELSPKEIAEVTGLTENVISVRIFRGLEKLRDILHITNETRRTKNHQ